MAIQLGALRDALIDAGSAPEKAARAAEEVATYDTRLAVIDTRLAVLTWMIGATLGLTVLAIGSLLAIWSKLGELGGQLGQVARLIH